MVVASIRNNGTVIVQLKADHMTSQNPVMVRTGTIILVLVFVLRVKFLRHLVECFVKYLLAYCV